MHQMRRMRRVRQVLSPQMSNSDDQFMSPAAEWGWINMQRRRLSSRRVLVPGNAGLEMRQEAQELHRCCILSRRAALT